MARERGRGYIYKQAGSQKYWCKFYLNGKPQRESTGTADEKEAQKYLTARLKERDADVIGAKPMLTAKQAKVSIGELLEALRKDYALRGVLSPQATSHFNRAVREFGDKMATAHNITSEVDSYKLTRLAGGSKPSAVNRVLEKIIQSCSFAVQQKRFTSAAVPYIKKLSEAGNARRVDLTESQLAAFIAALPNSDLQDFGEWSACCAQRKGEASLMTWGMLHGDELRIPGGLCKNRDGRIIPLIGTLAAIMERRKRARRMDCEFIFHRHGRQHGNLHKYWRSAARKANLPAGFVWHSLRSYAATRLIRSGVPAQIAMQIGGWKTQSMLQRYGIVSTDDMKNGLQQMAEYRQEQAAKEATQARKVVAIG
jgi:integrase